MRLGSREGLSSDRRSFMRQVGVTLLAGTGFVAAGGAIRPADAAQLVQRQCCRDSSCDYCPAPSRVRYRCVGCNQPESCECLPPPPAGSNCVTTPCQ